GGRTAEYVAPRNELEQAIADVWKETLSVSRVGVYDSFFELGGHSLLAAQMLWKLRQRFPAEVPLRKLFESPTVANVARIIDPSSAVEPAPSTKHGGIDFEVEAKLDADIAPPPGVKADVAKFDRVFLTGATGFLGSNLLQ